MKIIDINTQEVIDELPEGKSNFYCTKEYWEKYKQTCKEYGEEADKKLLYELFIKNIDLL